MHSSEALTNRCPETVIVSDYQRFENVFGAIRLQKVRDHFGLLPSVNDIPMIKDLFVDWYTFNEIMPVRFTYQLLPSCEIITETSYSLSIKRCNSAYIKAVRKKLDPFLDQKSDPFFEMDWGVKKTPALSLVLEYDATKYTLGEAWYNVGKDLNRFLMHLKKLFGKFVHIRTWQAHESGMPHVHLVIYFNNFEFSVQVWEDGSFRIHPKQKTKHHGKYCLHAIKDAWMHGFVDIKCIDNMQDTFKDVLKYVTRCLDGGLYTLTNAMVWYFRRQSFGISKDFIKEVWGTDKSIDSAEPSDADENSQLRSNSNRKLIAIEIFPIFPRFYFGYRPQTTLDNYKHPPPWGPYSENFIDNFAATKCDANVNIRDDGVAVTTYKLREFEIV